MIRPDLFRERRVTAGDHKGGSVTRGVYSILVVLGRVCEGGYTMRRSSRAVIRNHASADRRLSINRISSCKRFRVATCDLLTYRLRTANRHHIIIYGPGSISVHSEKASMGSKVGKSDLYGLSTRGPQCRWTFHSYIIIYTIRADHCRIGPFCCP